MLIFEITGAGVLLRSGAVGESATAEAVSAEINVNV